MAPGQPPVDINSPPKQSPTLYPSSFAPVLSNPLPNMDGAVDVDPGFFKGTNQDGSGLGPHFITMLVIKDKTKIHKQLISALSKTVTILTENLPNALVHCIKKSSRLPPLASATCNHFPTSGMQANNYMYKQNAWSLTPGIQNKPKMPAPKMGRMVIPSWMKTVDTKVQIASPQSCGSGLIVTSRMHLLTSRWNSRMSTSNSSGNLPRRRTATTRSSYTA